MEDVLQVKGIEKNISNRKILKNISFNVNKGDIVGLVGENGAGKTTIMRSILGMIKVDNGKIIINGKETNISSRKELSTVGSLIESPVIYPYLTGNQHLKLMSKSNDNNMAKYLIKQLNMDEYINKNASSYSLGMKQKLAIAIALINNPNLAILDEPINGLDPKSTKEVRNLIINLNKKGTTFIISSHILSELEKIINRVIIIKNGEKIYDDTLNSIEEKQNKVSIKTNQNDESLRILQDDKLDAYIQNDKLFIIGDFKLQHIISLLNNHNIEIEYINSSENDLEDEMLQILDQ